MYKFVSLLLSCIVFSLSAQSADPTKPFHHTAQSASKAKKQQQLVLQTIVAQGQQKSVVISGKLLNTGDQIGVYQLTEIANDYVVLTSPERELTLSLFSSVVAK